MLEHSIGWNSIERNSMESNPTSLFYPIISPFQVGKLVIKVYKPMMDLFSDVLSQCLLD